MNQLAQLRVHFATSSHRFLSIRPDCERVWYVECFLEVPEKSKAIVEDPEGEQENESRKPQFICPECKVNLLAPSKTSNDVKG